MVEEETCGFLDSCPLHASAQTQKFVHGQETVLTEREKKRLGLYLAGLLLGSAESRTFHGDGGCSSIFDYAYLLVDYEQSDFSIGPHKRFYSRRILPLRANIDLLLWWMLYERFADRYRSDEAKLALVTWFQVHSVLILACIGILPACLITLCYLGICGCGYSETRPYMEQ